MTLSHHTPSEVSNKGTSFSRDLTNSTSQQSPPCKSNDRTTAQQTNTIHIPNNNNKIKTHNSKNKLTQYMNPLPSRVIPTKKNAIPGAVPSIPKDSATTTLQQQQTATITNSNTK